MFGIKKIEKNTKEIKQRRREKSKKERRKIKNKI